MTDSSEISVAARRQLDAEERVLVPAICLWEIAMLVQKGRFQVDRPVQDFLRDGLAWNGVELFPLTPAVAARSGALGAAMHGDPADRLIAATALELSVPLVTRDARLTGLAGLRTIW